MFPYIGLHITLSLYHLSPYPCALFSWWTGTWLCKRRIAWWRGSGLSIIWKGESLWNAENTVVMIHCCTCVARRWCQWWCQSRYRNRLSHDNLSFDLGPYQSMYNKVDSSCTSNMHGEHYGEAVAHVQRNSPMGLMYAIHLEKRSQKYYVCNSIICRKVHKPQGEAAFLYRPRTFHWGGIGNWGRSAAGARAFALAFEGGPCLCFAWF